MSYPDFERRTSNSRPPPALGADGARLLLTDRDTERRLWYANVLEGAGYEVVSVSELAHALTEIAATLPAMIIANLSEPIADGMALCRKLRQERETRDLPVIVVTRSGDPFTREQIVRSGASGILTEPLGRALLLRQVRRLMARAKAHAGPVSSA
jgi:CheY-like chemotaxis protein